MHFSARNTNLLASPVYRALNEHGIRQESRNGPVLKLPGITTFHISRPCERVHLCRIRRANPFFHLFEAVAMLAGYNDAKFLARFAKNMMNFVDEGQDGFNAFYGTRMRRQDQFRRVLQILQRDPDSRRGYVDLWDIADIHKSTRDMACNVGFQLYVEDGRLCMATFNRSNDAIWGAVSGANVVHFSFFQEFAACSLGLPVGDWFHASSNLHVYTDNPQWRALIAHHQTLEEADVADYSTVPGLRFLPLTTAPMADRFIAALEEFVQIAASCFDKDHDRVNLLYDVVSRHKSHLFLTDIMFPMMLSWILYKRDEPVAAIRALSQMPAGNDWRIASTDWLQSSSKMQKH